MKHLKHLFSVIVVCSFVMLGIQKLGYIVRPTDTDEAYRQIETFHSLPEDSLEVIIYGSSRAFRGISPMEMYDKFGIGAYNYGWHWQKINTTKLFLKDSLSSQHPKVALIETCYIWKVLKDTDVTAEVYYCRYIRDKKAKSDYMKQCLGENPSLDRRLSYVMPLAMFHDNWNSLTKDSFRRLKSGMDSELLKSMGFKGSDAVNPIKISDPNKMKQKELNGDALEELHDIVHICSSNNIKVVFFTIPWQGNWEYRDAMIQFAKDNDCYYVNLFDHIEEMGLDGSLDYKDEGHVNSNGAAKIADFMGRYLTEHFSLTDMRNVKGSLWERANQM